MTINFTAIVSSADILAVVIVESLTGISAGVINASVLSDVLAGLSASVNSLSIVSGGSGVGGGVVNIRIGVGSYDSSRGNRSSSDGNSLLLSLLSVVFTELSTSFQGVTAIATNNAASFTLSMTSSLMMRINIVLGILAELAVTDLVGDLAVTDVATKLTVVDLVSNSSVMAAVMNMGVLSGSKGSESKDRSDSESFH